MNKPLGFYLKTVKKTSFPHRFLFIDIETLQYKELDTDIHRMRLGITCYVRIGKSPYDIQQEKWDFFTKQESICDYINSLTYDKNPLWIIASNPKFDLGAIGFIYHFTKWNWKLEFVAEKGMVFILNVKNDKRKIKVVAIQNYFPTSIAILGKWINKPKLDIDVFTDDLDLLGIYCFRDVEILMDCFLKYVCYVFDNDMGGFTLTRSAQAFMVFRHRFMSHKILIHKRPNVSKLERSSYHGGRVECIRIGKQPKQDYIQLDVNSMYSYVMKNNDYPTMIKGHVEKHNLKHLETLLDKRCVTARVLIDTDKPVYAHNLHGKCCFPIGVFWETLNTRALKYALKHNHIKDISCGVYYRKAKIFKRYIEYFWSQRLKANKKNDYVMSQFIRIFLNAFYGKWAQQVPILIEKYYEPENKFEIEHWYNAVTKEFGETTTLFHETRTYKGKQDSKNTYCGISAHITEDARLYLWNLLNKCGLENVYYCDTDCLIVTRETYENKLLKYYGEELGMLKIEQESDYLYIHTLKDYVFGDKVVRKGVGKKAKQIDETTFEVLTSYSLKTLMDLNLQDGAILTTVTKTLKRNYTKGHLNLKGEVHPFHLNDFDDLNPIVIDSF